MNTSWTRRQVLGAATAGALRGQARRPNILFLLTDDQRFDTIAALGHPEVKTPNLDRLVRRGTAFTRAHIMGGTIQAVCAPSRAMLLTGQTLFHVHDSIIAPQPGRPARPFALFPEALKQAGYTTFATGKWHNGPRLFARCFGAAESVFFGGMSDQNRMPVQAFDATGGYAKAREQVEDRYSSEMFADAAVSFLKGRKEQEAPFLAYVAFTSPHDPRTPPRKYLDLYDPARMTLPPNFAARHPFDNGELNVRDELLLPWPRTPEAVRREIAAYYGMVSEVDAQIGRVLDALEASGQADNTVIVFAADNGLAVGQHGLLGKQNLYDHSVRVPLVLAGPGVPRGERREALCYLSDVFPTMFELAEVPVPETVEGQSLVPVLRDRKASVRDSVFFAYRDVQRGVRTDRWKLIRYRVPGAPVQVFDMREDPWETVNLAGEPGQQGQVKEMDGQLREWMRRVGDPLEGAVEW